MRKALGVFLVVGILAFAVSAQAEQDGEMKGMKDGMKGKGMKGGMMMGMGMMQKSEMVASSDGGVIVMSGGKLTKYDKDLNVIKEVELKKPSDSKGMCPMCSRMKSGEGEGDAPEGAGPEASGADEHQAHH